MTSVSCVGPASNASPIDPISSTSATKASPTAPPVTPAANLAVFAFLFRSDAVPKALATLGLARFA